MYRSDFNRLAYDHIPAALSPDLFDGMTDSSNTPGHQGLPEDSITRFYLRFNLNVANDTAFTFTR
jgi:hypothetical protein